MRNKMSKDEIEFLEQQLKWIKEQDRILAKIEVKLIQMKKIAIYATEHDLSDFEINELNKVINELRQEVIMLEKQLQGTVH